MAMRAPVAVKGTAGLSVAPARSRAVLKVIPGGRNKPSQITVTGEAWDESQAEIIALRAEGREHAEKALPLARRLHIAAIELGPIAEQTAAALVYELTRFARRYDDSPKDAA